MLSRNNLSKQYEMNLQDQNNLVRSEMIKLYEMITAKIQIMENLNAPKSDMRRVVEQQLAVKTILENYFDFYIS